MRPITIALCISLLACSPSPTSSAPLSDPRYRPAFELYVELYRPGDTWQIATAQCYQESLLEPLAVSPVGAQGLCQFMPGTWREMEGRLGLRGSPFNPVLSIRFAQAYMARLKRIWSSERPNDDRVDLAHASYNAGAGNIIKAQRACGGARHWPEIAPCLVRVTGRHSRETLTYVSRIRRWQRDLAR